MLPDYLAIGGVEIVNSWRAKAYAGTIQDCGIATSSCAPCGDDAGVWLNDGEPYKGVEDDPAPWWDPAIPESLNVAGVVGMEVQGLHSGVPTLSTGGANGGRVRDIEFRVGIEAADECAFSYLMGWLAAALGEPACATVGGSQCSGQQACVIACCPDIDPETGEASNDPIRTIMDVTTVEGPTVTDKRTFAGGRVLAQVEFTLRTRNIGIFRNPSPALVVDVAPYNGETEVIDLPAVYEECADEPSCAVDPDCVPDPLAPLPEPPVDPCYPTDPFEGKRLVETIDSRDVTNNLDLVPVVTVTSGESAPARNVTVRFYLNPFGVPCENIDELNPCRACADLTVSYIPPGGTLTIDGRLGRSWITCRTDEGLASFVPNVFGPMGGVSDIPVIACGPGLCVEIITDASVPVDAMVRVELVPRQEAG